MKEIKAKPFLKWAGGKRQLIYKLKEYSPKKYNTYIEPFLGAGALFFELEPKKAILSDINSELINVFKVVRDNVEELIKDLKTHENNKEYYYKIRAIDRDDNYKNLSDIKKASRFIYLNKTCFNGLYRVNKKGYFNVPFGKYKNPKICDEANLRSCSKVLKNATILHQSYEKTLEKATNEDFVYLDPPYAPVAKTANFTQYDKSGFNDDAQEKLRNECSKLKEKNIEFLLSNSDAKLIKDLYKDFTINEVDASRSINSKGDGRGKITELLIK